MLEALNFLKHWCTGLVAIQTGAMAVLGSLVKDMDKSIPMFWFGFAIICFLVSIFIAAHVLGAIPMIAQKLPEEKEIDTNIYRIRNYFKIPIWIFAFLQHLFFIGGIFGFGIFVLKFGMLVNPAIN